MVKTPLLKNLFVNRETLADLQEVLEDIVGEFVARGAVILS